MSNSEFDAHQALLRRLAQLSDEQLLWRMQQLGYWNGPLPPDPPDELRERAELEAELRQLMQSGVVRGDIEAALRAERKRRFAESRQRRAERAKARAAERAKAREAFAKLKEQSVLHVGRGYSAGLSLTPIGDPAVQGRLDRLRALGLPVILSPEGLAQTLDISLARLRWLTYHRDVARVVHYHRFALPKKTGGLRLISAPKPELKAAQTWIHEQLLSRLQVADEAHGFVPGRSSLSNAQLHTGRQVVINLDLKDFFPSIHFHRVRELYVAFGYPRRVATLLALLCTEPPRVASQIEGDVHQQTWYVALGARALPQGACTSPTISNLLCWTLDRRLRGLAAAHGYTYSRYADDLTFSGDDAERIGKLLGSVRRVIAQEGFRENEAKTHIMRPHRRQEVTGLSVNSDTPKLPRDAKRRLRAMLHNAAKHGLAAANHEGLEHFPQYLSGWVAYACMVEPDSAPQWRQALAAALARG